MSEAFEFIVATTQAKIAPLGFHRSGAILRLLQDRTCGIVQFQKSVTSSRECVKFTINFAVVLKDLLDPWQPELEKSRYADGHVISRIGDFLPGRPDKWWELNESIDLVELSSDIASLIYDLGVPFIKRYLSVRAVIAHWSAGEYPGITSRQCEKYLSRLQACIG